MSEDNSGDKKRRDVLKALPVATVGIPMVSGVGAAMPDTSETSDERITREEKARQAGYDWDEDWIDQDMIGKSSVETTETFSKNQTNCLGIDATLAGIDFTFEVCFSPCEAELTVTAFDQSESTTVTCSEYCRSLSLNAGAAYIDIEVCFNWDLNCVDLNAEGCVWEITRWNCDTTNISRCA
jgi:hypothetical protein